MSEFEPLVSPHRVRTMQIIAGAMIAGVVTFLAVVLFLVLSQGQPPAPGQTPTLSLLAVGLMLFLGPGSALFPIVVEQQATRQIASGSYRGAEPGASTVGQLLALKQKSLILGLALLEATAFTSLIAFLLERKGFVLGVTALALALMAVKFPTHLGVTRWVEGQVDRIEELIDEIEAADDPW